MGLCVGAAQGPDALPSSPLGRRTQGPGVSEPDRLTVRISATRFRGRCEALPRRDDFDDGLHGSVELGEGGGGRVELL